MVKNLPALQETRVWSLGQEDPLEKGMVTHSIIFLPGKIQRTEERGVLQPIGSQRFRHYWKPLTSSVLQIFLPVCVSFWCKWRSIMKERKTPTQQTEVKDTFNSTDHWLAMCCLAPRTKIPRSLWPVALPPSSQTTGSCCTRTQGHRRSAATTLQELFSRQRTWLRPLQQHPWVSNSRAVVLIIEWAEGMEVRPTGWSLETCGNVFLFALMRYWFSEIS